MQSKVKVKVAANFKSNLSEIESFYRRREEIDLFDLFLDELSGTIIPHLERFPSIGRAFSDHALQSAEAASRVDQLIQKLSKFGEPLEIREYISRSHVILYALAPKHIYLLSVRHQRQVSFDFDAMWE